MSSDFEKEFELLNSFAGNFNIENYEGDLADNQPLIKPNNKQLLL